MLDYSPFLQPILHSLPLNEDLVDDSRTMLGAVEVRVMRKRDKKEG